MKKGYIKISDVIIREMWDKIYIIFKDFRPTHIEFRHWENDTWYYYGVSELFEEVKEGWEVPQYDVVFTEQTDKQLIYEFKKVIL